MATWKTKQSPNAKTTFAVTHSKVGFVTVAIDTRRNSDGMRIAHDHVVIPLEKLNEMASPPTEEHIRMHIDGECSSMGEPFRSGGKQA